jgi:DNA-binding MarR family transcriptional regulator
MAICIKTGLFDAKDLFTKRKESHTTKLTNAQKSIVSTIYALKTATQADIARRLKKSQRSISDHLKTIMANTPYVTSERGDHGENIHKTNIAPLDIAKMGIVKLPDDY